MSFRNRLQIVLILGIFPAFALCSDLEEAWTKASLFLFNDAQRVVSRSTEEGRNRDYAQAILLLNTQPKTEANIQQSAGILRNLIEAKKDDEIGISSKYYLGRIAQIHQASPDPVLAEKIYRELLHDFPESPEASQAVVKLSLIRLYSGLTRDQARQRLAEVEGFSSLVKGNNALVCYHLLVGDYIIRFGGSKEKALEHFVIAEQAGIRRSTSRADTEIRIGMLARELGKKEIAQTYFKKFIGEFPRDSRTYAVQTLSAELQSGVQK
ncbi:MAG: hypothetical protein V4507_06465 [Verrucomicrobiota bacterium]